MQPKYKRVLLKLSGESLAGEAKHGIDFDIVTKICEAIKKCADAGVQIGVVVGGGNFWRGRSGGNMDRTRADHMGMLATAINALAMCDALEAQGIETRVQTGFEMRAVAEPYIRGKAVRHLQKGRVVIFACGTGNPYFSTDTAAALRAAEIGAEIILHCQADQGLDQPKAAVLAQDKGILLPAGHNALHSLGGRAVGIVLGIVVIHGDSSFALTA